jgi:hypothetical protein
VGERVEGHPRGRERPVAYRNELIHSSQDYVQGRDVVGETVLRSPPVIVDAVSGVSKQAGLDTMRLKQLGDAIEAPLRRRKRLTRQVGI